MYRLLAPTLVAASAVVLTGCGPDVQRDAEYGNTIQLRRALVDSGYECPGQQQEDHGTDATQEEFTLDCGNGLRLGVMSDEAAEDMHTTMTLWHVIAKPGHTLHGPNWYMSSEDIGRLSDIQEDFGGKVIAE